MKDWSKFKRKSTNWNKYGSNPNNFFSKYLFLNNVIRSYDRLLANVNFNYPIKILEFGSGTGYIDLYLCKRFNVKKLTAIDFNEKMLNIAKHTLSNLSCDKDFVHNDFFKVKIDDKHDIVHSQGVIEHFEPKKRLELLRKHYDATKKGGFCIIYSPTPTKPYLFFRKIAEIIGAWKFSDEVPLEKDVIIKEMEMFGFKVIKIDYFWKYFLTEVGILFQKI